MAGPQLWLPALSMGWGLGSSGGMGVRQPLWGLVRWAEAGLDLLGDQPLMAQQNRLAEPASPLMGLGQCEGLLVERTKRPSKSFSGLPKAPGLVLAGQTCMYGTQH